MKYFLLIIVLFIVSLANAVLVGQGLLLFVGLFRVFILCLFLFESSRRVWWTAVVLGVFVDVFLGRFIGLSAIILLWAYFLFTSLSSYFRNIEILGKLIIYIVTLTLTTIFEKIILIIFYGGSLTWESVFLEIVNAVLLTPIILLFLFTIKRWIIIDD